MKLTNPDSIHAEDVNDETVIAVTVTFHVGYIKEGHPMIRAYRCQYPQNGMDMFSNGIPQGSNISERLVPALMEALAPVLLDAGAKADQI